MVEERVVIEESGMLLSVSGGEAVVLSILETLLGSSGIELSASERVSVVMALERVVIDL